MLCVDKSHKLDDVCYDIRGPVHQQARRLEEEGHRIIKLNIGNPAAFGLEAPEEIIKDVLHNLPSSQGYGDSRGLFSARKAIMQYYQRKGLRDIDIDDIFIGNGVSELILMSMQALLNNGDEMLVPAPDYPLWTASVTLSGGRPVHYICDEKSGWFPDVEDMRRKITPKTRGIVLINPNNPTGSVYSRDCLLEIIELAREHNLIIFADEIYDRILYENAFHHSVCTLCDDVLVVTFSGLSKVYRAAGFRQGWLVLSGPKHLAQGYIGGLELLSTMRLCGNIPTQHAIQTALGGYQSINELLIPGGRLRDQRDYAWERLNAIEGIECTKPDGALYLFPKLDQKRFNIKDDQKMIADLLLQEKLLLVQGSGFNWPAPDHFRIVTLAPVEILEDAFNRLERFFSRYTQ
ncbi:pyridoxal phosphate-dependent aminotransferase [Dongshaea marina]|uniref:pyridoxal phosphate-dependent aminotransferase n=1 Tax=Dongshaea marina TaxID=2047966 RepID=UPI000D3E3FB8|nr:pyridoxal phosphate-dependent aminotransferase [Dongshaea marina]